MPWTEEQVDELIKQVRRDFALKTVTDNFEEKLLIHGVTQKQAEAAIGKHSYIGRYNKVGPTIGFWDKRRHIFVAWKSEYQTRVKTCFIVQNGLAYFRRQDDFELLWSP
jgi:hypothetical protein